MPDAVVFERVAPVVPVLDLDAALERYRRLGFVVEPYTGGERYGFVDRTASRCTSLNGPSMIPTEPALTCTCTSPTPTRYAQSGPLQVSRDA